MQFSGNSMQQEVTNQTFWLVNYQRSSSGDRCRSDYSSPIVQIDEFSVWGKDALLYSKLK